VLAGIGLGALLAHALARGEKSPPVDPSLWRAWGLAGGAASLCFYLIEYFPGHLGWRLEVSHPLHALAWAAAGDWLARLTGRGAGRPWWMSSRDRTVALAGLLLLAVPPLLMLVAPARTFVIGEKFLWALHVDYISEFSPLLAPWPGLQSLLVRVNLLPLLGLATVGLLIRGGLAPRQRALLALGLVPAALLTMLALSQERWMHVACALWLAVLVAVAAVTRSDNFAWTIPRRVLAALFLALVLLPYPLRAGLDAWRGASGLSRENIRQFAMRDLAYWLRRRAGTDPVVVLSGPTTTTELIYHGGFRGIGTLYWENAVGLRTLVDIYGAADPARALELMRAHGVTHLVLPPWGPFAKEAARLAQGLRVPDEPVGAAFALDLLKSGRGLPDWVRPLAYHLPQAGQFKDQFALVLELAPAQNAATAAVGRAQFFAAMGNSEAAEDLLRQVLADKPDHVTALVTLARLQRTARDRAAHAATMQRVLPLLAADSALELRDRVALAVELAAWGRQDAARIQVERCWAAADDAALARLPPESLPLLLRLTRDLPVNAPAGLLQFAETLQASDRASVARP
jgi:tetratricopeptide (TPR) repeat protein